MNAQKTTYKQVSKSAEKNILSVWKNVCTFAASKHTMRCKTADKSCQPFLYPFIINMQANGLVVCGSSNARKDKHCSPGQHHKPYFFLRSKIQCYEHKHKDSRRDCKRTNDSRLLRRAQECNGATAQKQQYDDNGNIIATYQSMRQAANALGVDKKAIQEALKRQIHCKGYLFKRKTN